MRIVRVWLFLVGVAVVALSSSCANCRSARQKAMNSFLLQAKDFTYTNHNGTIHINKYIGTNTAVIIPAKIAGLPVTCIGHRAFANRRSLTSITIPANVTSVGPMPFLLSPNLTGIEVDPNNPAYTSVDGVLFDKSRTSLIVCPDGKAGTCTIPSGVVSIGYYAFRDCSRLTGITIPDSVTRIIGNQTFANCSRLTNAALGNGLARIVSYAFSACTNLASVSIGSGVTRIDAGAFENCPNLTGVYFKGNVPSLNGSDVFKSDNKATVYYLSGTTGWGETFGGRPTAVWKADASDKNQPSISMLNSSTPPFTDQVVSVLQDFESSAMAPRHNYGYQGVGTVQRDPRGGFFRFSYNATANHSGYEIPAAHVAPRINSALFFKYRSGGVSDLRLALKLGNQSVSWFLDVAPSKDWTEMELPLAGKLTQPLNGTTVQNIHATTFAKAGATLDLDDFVLRPATQTPKEGYRAIEDTLRIMQERSVALRRYVRVSNLSTDRHVYAPAERIHVSYDFVNTSKNSLLVPSNNQYGHPMFLIGIAQTWLEPMDEAAKAGTVGGLRQGNRFAAGGGVAGIGKNDLKPGEHIRRQYEMTVPHAGTWRYYVEFRDDRNETQLNEEMVEFTTQGGEKPGDRPLLPSKPAPIGLTTEQYERTRASRPMPQPASASLGRSDVPVHNGTIRPGGVDAESPPAPPAEPGLQSAGAFINCIGLTNITIPNASTSIGKQAFQGCTNLPPSIRARESVMAGSRTRIGTPNRLSGEALEKHLQEYQMQLIRQGQPPLPIPLTPDMDNQLVNEGILPPQEQDGNKTKAQPKPGVDGKPAPQP